jgi:hypothetical protein
MSSKLPIALSRPVTEPIPSVDPLSDETPEAAKARYLGQLNGDFEPKPTVVVDSGNGIQALWRLETPIDLTQYPVATNDKGNPVW